MIDKNDPRQDSAKTDTSDDDAIIDLTDEVTINTNADDDIVDLKDALEDESPDTEKEEEGEDLTAREATPTFDLPEEEFILDLDDQFAADEAGMQEDDLIASAINDSLEADDIEPDVQDDEFSLDSSDDDLIILDNEEDVIADRPADVVEDGTTADETDQDLFDLEDDEFSLDSSDDDVIILDNEEDVMADRPADVGEDETTADETDQDLFDLEEEIQIKYEADEEEDEPMALEDERPEHQSDFVSLVLGESSISGQRDQTEEPTEYLQFNSRRQDDMMDRDEDRDETVPSEPLSDAEATGLTETEDLPDLADVGELDFEDDDETDHTTAPTNDEIDSGDEIIARTVGQSLNYDDGSDQFEPDEDAELDLKDDADSITLDENSKADDRILALEDDETLEFEEEGGLLVDLEDAADIEDDDKIIPLNGSDAFDDEDEDDIVEITEFDQHYPIDTDNMLQKAGIIDTSGADEDDYLELLEVEEDLGTEQETIAGSDESDERTEFVELEEFFNEDLEQDELEPEAAATDLKNFRQDDLLPDEEEGKAADVPAPESAAQNAASDSEDEAFDFNFDAGSIARQVDRLDAFLSENPIDEPEVASLPEDYPEGENTMQENPPVAPQFEELASFSPSQIDAAIERVINEKFSGRIESIIYDVIEKAVAKEIARLKGVLLDTPPADDN